MTIWKMQTSSIYVLHKVKQSMYHTVYVIRKQVINMKSSPPTGKPKSRNIDIGNKKRSHDLQQLTFAYTLLTTYDFGWSEISRTKYKFHY